MTIEDLEQNLLLQEKKSNYSEQRPVLELKSLQPLCISPGSCTQHNKQLEEDVTFPVCDQKRRSAVFAERVKGAKYIVTKDDLTLGGENIMQHTDQYHRYTHLKRI